MRGREIVHNKQLHQSIAIRQYRNSIHEMCTTNKLPSWWHNYIAVGIVCSTNTEINSMINKSSPFHCLSFVFRDFVLVWVGMSVYCVLCSYAHWLRKQTSGRTTGKQQSKISVRLCEWILCRKEKHTGKRSKRPIITIVRVEESWEERARSIRKTKMYFDFDFALSFALLTISCSLFLSSFT